LIFRNGRREGFRGYLTPPPWRSPVARPLREHYRKSMRFLRAVLLSDKSNFPTFSLVRTLRRSCSGIPILKSAAPNPSYV
jgi:hypothetical protein